MKHNSILLCLLFAIVANFIAPAAKAQVNTTDSLALVDLYNSTSGPNWSHHNNWLTTKPVRSWQGVKVTATGSYVAQLLLNDNQLTGTIPSSIGNLTKLNALYLDGNQITGTIPATLGNLKNLANLYLFNNQLTGTVPSTLGNLKKLISLHLAANQLTGTIPASLGNLTNLLFLYLGNNELSGAIPFSLNKLLGTSIYLDNNRLTKLADDYPRNDTDKIHLSVDHNLFTFTTLQVLAKYYPNVVYQYSDTILPIHQNGNILSVSAGGTLSNNTYTWHQVGVNTIITIKKDSTFTPAASGKYYVTVTNKVVKRNLTLYSDTISYVMPAAKQSNTLIAKATTPSIVTSHMQVYPNPATNLLHIQTTGTATIALTNATGKTLLTKTINNTADINVSKYANGVYYIQNKTTGEMQKIVIVH